MNLEASTLGVVVKSTGISTTTADLNNLGNAAATTEQKVSSLTSKLSSLSGAQKSALQGVGLSQEAATTKIEKFIKRLEEQSVLFGASREGMATYKTAMMGATDAQVALAGSLGKQVDGLIRAAKHTKELAAAQVKAAAEAVAAQKLVDAQKGKESSFLASLKLQADSYGKNNEQLAILRATQAGYSAETIKMAGVHGAALDAIKKSKEGISSHTAAMQDAHAMVRGLSGGLGALWLTYGNIAPMIAGVAVAASLKGIVSVGKDVEHTLEGIRVKGQETVENVNAMRESIMDLGKGVYGPKEVATAFETLILAGLNAKQALSGIKDALNLATVGGTTIEKSAYTLVQVGTALGYSAEGYGRIADVISATAAASMSSVESVSESFKAGSVLGKLYGATLSDIGVQFALLSNLGIRGSAAGTSAKNFYSVLFSGADKVTKALSDIGLTAKALKDAEGAALPFQQVMQKIYDGFEKNNLNADARQAIIKDLTNERGVKLMVEGLDAIQVKAGEAQSKMAELFDRIDQSYGLAATGAAAMALTVDSQLKSVKNTLETQFLAAFQKVEPQISVVAGALKDAFGSDKFKDSITGIALAVGNFTVMLVENIGTIVKFAEAFLLFKGVTAIVTTAATAIAAIATSLGYVTAAARITAVALGPISIALTAIIYLWYKWTDAKTENNAADEASKKYSADFVKGLDEENKRLDQQIRLLGQGKTAAEAQTIAMQELQMQKVREENRAPVARAQAEADKLFGRLSLADQRIVDYDRKSAEAIASGTGRQAEAFKEVLKAQDRVNFTKGEEVKLNAIVSKQLDDIRVKSKNVAAQADQQSRERIGKPSGSEDRVDAASVAAISDAYQAALTEIQGRIKIVQMQMTDAVAEATSLNKQGLLGDIGLIEKRRDIVIDAAVKELALIDEKIAKERPENQTAMAQKFANKQIELFEKIKEAASKAYRETEEEFSKSETRKLQAQVAGWKARGDYSKAFMAEQGAAWNPQIAKLESDIENGFNLNLNTDQLEKWKEELATIKEMLKKGEASAFFKEADYEVQALLRTLDASVTSIEAKTQDGSLLGKLFGGEELSRIYTEQLPGLEKKLEEARIRMEASDADADVKAYQTRLVAYNKHIKHKRDIYKDFIADIDRVGSEGFRALFDKTDGSWKSYVKKMKDSFKTYLIDEIYKMLARPFVMNILANIAGAAGATGLQGALQNTASAGNSLSNLTGGGGIYNQFATSSVGQSLGLSGMAGGTVAAASIGTGAEFGFATMLGDSAATMAATTVELSALGSTIGAALPWIGGALAIGSMLGLFGGGGPVDRNSKYQRQFGESGAKNSATDPYRDNFRFSDSEMQSSLDSFTANLAASEQNAIKSLGLTTEQIQKINDELGKAADITYGFGIEHSDWMQSQADEQITAVRLQAMATALGKSVTEIVAAMDPMFGALVNAGKLIGLTSDELAKVAGNSANMQAMTGVINNYYQNYFSQAEKQVKTNEALSKAFSDLGVVMPATKEAFRSLVEGLDLTTEGGAKAFTGLMNLQGAFSEFASSASSTAEVVKRSAESIASERDSLQSKLDSAMGNTAAIRERELAALDKSNVALQMQIYAIEDAKVAAEELSKAQEAAAEASRQYMDSLSAAVDNAYAALERAVSTEKATLDDAYKVSVDALDKQRKIAVETSRVQVDAANKTLQAVTRVSDLLKSALKSVQVESAAFDMQRRQAAIGYLNTKLAETNAGVPFGDTEMLEDALQVVAKPSEDYYATFEDYARAQGLVAITIDGLQKNAKVQVSVAQMSLNALEAANNLAEDIYTRQKEDLDIAHAADLAKLDETLATAKMQIDVMRGIDVSVINVSAAVANLGAAIGGFVAAKNAEVSAANAAAAAAKVVVTPSVTRPATPAPQSADTSSSAYAPSYGGLANPGAYQFIPGVHSYQNTVDIHQNQMDSARAAVLAGDWYQPTPNSLTADQVMSMSLDDWFKYGNSGLDQAYWKETYAAFDAGLNPVDTKAQSSYIQDAYQNVLGRAADASGLAFYTQQLQSGMTINDVISEMKNSAEYANMPKYASGGIHEGGWRMVGENGPEIEYTGPSAIINNTNSKKMFDQSEVADEVRQLREDLRAANVAIAQNTSQTAKWLQRWDGDGMPEVRVIA